MIAMKSLPTRLAKELETLVAVLDVEVVVRLVEVAASGVVIMVCNAPLLISHAVAVFCPHRQ